MALVSICIPTVEGNIALLKETVNGFIQHTPREQYELVISCNEFRGYEIPVNWSLKEAKGDILLIANDDLCIAGEWLPPVLAALEDKKVGIVAHKLACLNGGKFAAFWFVAIPRKVLDEVGLLDENYNTFTSDQDYCHRVRKAGYEIRFIELPMVAHKGCQTTYKLEDGDDRKRYGRELFARKWGKTPEDITYD